VCGQQRSVEERVSDLEKRVSALEKPSPFPTFKPSASPTPAVETKSPLEPKQASEETKADTEAKPTPEPTWNTEELNYWYALAPGQLLFAVARIIPDQVYIQRHDLDSVAVAIFRDGEQGPAVVARHDFRGRFITQIEWSPDSKFLLFTTASSSGHSPWHAAAFLFCAADNSFRDVDAAIGSVTSPKFRFEPPDIAIMEVKKGEMPEEEMKLPLAKTMHHMPRVK
jgi:hypothetical protein